MAPPDQLCWSIYFVHGKALPFLSCHSGGRKGGGIVRQVNHVAGQLVIMVGSPGGRGAFAGFILSLVGEGPSIKRQLEEKTERK